jgi:hypothetical protein
MLERVKTAVAKANGLALGAGAIGHLAHVEPTLRFLRPLLTEADLAALPDRAWILWSATTIRNGEGDPEGVEKDLLAEEAVRSREVDAGAYRFPAMLPAQSPAVVQTVPAVKNMSEKPGV